MHQTIVIFKYFCGNFAVVLQNLFFRRGKNRGSAGQIIRQGVGMCPEMQLSMEQDAEKNRSAIQPVAAEHAFATQSVERGEVFEHEITEAVRAHPPYPRNSL